MASKSNVAREGGSLERMVRLPKEFERHYYAHRPCDDEACDTANFRQNLEAKDGDHWLLELNLERWRSAADMAAYLRWAADQMELLASRSNAGGQRP